MEILIGVIVGLVVLMFLVTAHEFGHFLIARKNGVRVLEFGIGFPPRAKAWIKDPKTGKWRKLPRSEWPKDRASRVVVADSKKSDEKALAQKGLIFSLNWLPIGGFCQMDGESAEDERKGTFGAASYWSKTKILFAGVAMNWLVAFVILTILAWTGMPAFLEGQFTIDADTRYNRSLVEVTSIAENSPADQAGIKAGDKIVKVNGEEVRLTSDVTEKNQAHAGGVVTYEIERDSNCTPCQEKDNCNCESDEMKGTFETNVMLNPADAEYLLGVTMKAEQAMMYSTWSAPIVGAGLTLQLTGETFRGLGIMVGNLVSGTARLFSFNSEVREAGQEALSEVRDSVSGPVGIIGVLFPAFTSAGPANLAFLTALISVSLACMNVLPIPALDGGRWLLITIFKLRKKKLTQEMEEKIVSRAFIVLVALIILVTILDIVRIAN